MVMVVLLLAARKQDGDEHAGEQQRAKRDECEQDEPGSVAA